MTDGPGTFEVETTYLLVGRTFEEYRWMFALETDDLAGRSVLDCPGGPGSFTAVASQVGASVVAVDPAYGPPAATLEVECETAVERVVAQLREKHDLFVLDEYRPAHRAGERGRESALEAVETRGRYLRAAAQRFLADYARNPGRYLPAALPTLPFDADAFDLALSGNFLFLYDDRLDLAFHRDSLRELARVAREVRVFPLASLDRERSAFVDPVAESLRAAGLTVEFREVPYEFQPGATEMLVLPDAAGYRPSDE